MAVTEADAAEAERRMAGLASGMSGHEDHDGISHRTGRMKPDSSPEARRLASA